MKNIAILTGGDSSEHDISLLTAANIHKNLNPKLFKGYIIHLKNNTFTTFINNTKFTLNKQNFTA